MYTYINGEFNAWATLYLCVRERLLFAPAGDHWVCVGVGARNLLLEGRLQHFQDGLAHFILEILAHEHIEQRVQAAVEEGQAGCDRHSDSSHVVEYFARVLGHVVDQLDQDHDVIRSPAQEKGGDDCGDDLKRATRLTGQGAISSQAVDDDGVAGDDHREGHHEPQEEAGDGHRLVSKLPQLDHGRRLVVVREGVVVEAVDDVVVVCRRPRVSEDKVWRAEDQSQDPDAQTHTRRLA